MRGVEAQPVTPVRAHRGWWAKLARRPQFWAAAGVMAIIVAMAVTPQLFTSLDPAASDLRLSRAAPSPQAWFGRDLHGADVYTQTVYGARMSVAVGVLTSLATTVIGVAVGSWAALGGRWADAALMRFSDVILAIPTVLGAIVVMTVLPSSPADPQPLVIARMVGVLTAFSWPTMARLVRAMLLSLNQAEFVTAARSMGASTWQLTRWHLLPHCWSMLSTMATINVGVFIAAEATLSYLGIGSRSSTLSWGVAIADASTTFYSAPHTLIFPAAFLTVTVVACVGLGDLLRAQLDPRASSAPR